MMPLTRRSFLKIGSGSLAAVALSERTSRVYGQPGRARFKIGVPDWSLRQEGKLDAIALAKRIGFDGLQVSLGVGTDRLPLSDAALQRAYLDEARRVNLPLASVCLNILHRNVLKSDPLAV